MTPVVREAGDSALVLQLADTIDPDVNAGAIAIAAAIRGAQLPGVRDVVSTFRSVVVYFDPLRVDVERVRASLIGAEEGPGVVLSPRRHEIPVAYGGESGPDLADVAACAGLDEDAVVGLHADRDYRVYMLGFLPGFAYLGAVPAPIGAPRRPSPRLRVPAGSVGIAGSQTGVYPRAAPGGWRIIGRTETRMFDPTAASPSLLAPGDVVRFVRTPELERPRAGATETRVDAAASASRPPGAALTVLRPGVLSTLQDLGRWGHQDRGIPVSGALDVMSHRAANALVGNDRHAATIEATLAGPDLRAESDTVMAVAGADLGVTADGAPIAMNRAVSIRAGATLRVGSQRAGSRAYIAVAGGFDVPPVLGSRSTHVLTEMGGVGGRALAAGDCLSIGSPAGAPHTRSVAVTLASGSGGARLRVMRGPQDEYFPDAAFELLESSRFTLAPESNRMGYRLRGISIPRLDRPEMISDATFTGAVQVPASGQPILLMADRQTTGGYPQIAVVITADLPLAAQLAPGDWIEFEWCSRRQALAALVAAEGRALALE